jgi:adenosylcobinamide kinase/adenosylcobinamide-phosphate guanylyltransferase
MDSLFPNRALILGGARSGKSAFAERLAALRDAGDADRVYLATAEPGDAEMQARIAAHQARRGAGWRTVEAPLDLPGALSASRAQAPAVLVDCLTLWLSNLMLAGRDWRAEVDVLAQVLAAEGAPVILVSNEVGLGLVPETPLGREFRDAQGALNQKIATTCDYVAFVAAGLPLTLKGRAPEGL